MLTPKQLRQLEEILLQETQIRTPELSTYVANALAGKATSVGRYFRISINGRLEASRPSGPKPYHVRLQTRSVIRAITRAAQVGIPIGPATKEWMATALRSADFRKEAEECLRMQEIPSK